MLTAGEVLRRTAGYLAERGSPSPRLDAELLLAHVLGVERIALYTDHDRPLTAAETDAYRALVARRGRREPVAYLTGGRAFRRLHLQVGPAVLVPRPETEGLVEWTLEVAPPGAAVLDWGTGSGAVALALADERTDLRVAALDRSADALQVARANDPEGRVEWLRSDGFAAVAGRRFAVVAANPPYLSPADLAAAPAELAHEPADALVAGPTGLEALEALAAEGPAHLEPGGWLLAEVGAGQAEAVEALWRDAGMVGVASRPDLAGIPRIVGGRDAR
jgi:release factor glutamine methyltransferase